MDIEVFNNHFNLDIYGFGGIASNKDYKGAAFKLNERVWEVVKTNEVKNKGKNIWVYQGADKVFTGIEIECPSNNNNYGLEKLTLRIEKYAYFKHIGSYNFIKRVGQNMINKLNKKGFEIISPYIEIYGHWENDESKLETELIMCLK